MKVLNTDMFCSVAYILYFMSELEYYILSTRAAAGRHTRCRLPCSGGLAEVRQYIQAITMQVITELPDVYRTHN